MGLVYASPLLRRARCVEGLLECAHRHLKPRASGWRVHVKHVRELLSLLVSLEPALCCVAKNSLLGLWVEL